MDKKEEFFIPEPKGVTAFLTAGISVTASCTVFISFSSGLYSDFFSSVTG